MKERFCQKDKSNNIPVNQDDEIIVGVAEDILGRSCEHGYIFD